MSLLNVANAPIDLLLLNRFKNIYLSNNNNCKNISCFVDSCVRVWIIKPNLWFSICNMKFVQHIKEIFFVKNGSQSNSQEENKKKIKISQKNSCIMDSCVGVWTFSPNLWFSICNMKFVQHIQVIILPENLSQNKSNQGFAKNFLLCILVRRSLGFKTNFLLIKVEIHTLPKNLSQN
jgi:hypothetical protein